MNMPRIKLVLGVVVALLTVGIIIFVVILVTSEANTCQNYVELPSYLSFSNTNGDVRVSWPDSVLYSDCNFTYILDYNVDRGEDFSIITTDFSYTIPNLALCANLRARLWAISEGGVMTEDPIERNYSVIPYDAYVTNIRYFDATNGMLVTWDKPVALEECDVHYNVEYSSERGLFNLKTETESVTIPNDSFCLEIQLRINAMVGSTSSGQEFDFYREGRDMNIQFSISPQDANELVVSWKHPNEEFCSFTYQVSYYGIPTHTINVTVPERRFGFIHCDRAFIGIIPFAFDGTRGDLVLVDATQYPDRVESMGAVSVTPGDAGLLLEWTPLPPPIGFCEITYNIEFATDLGNVTNSTLLPSIDLPRTSYCFNVEAEVQPVIGPVTGESTRITSVNELNPVNDLVLVRSTTSNILIAFWMTHQLQDQCDLTYAVTYQHGSILIDFITDNITVSFDVAYCATTIVRVKAITIGGDIESGEKLAKHTEGYPDFVEAPENVRVSETETSAIISWEPRESLSECSNLYTVIGRNEVTNEENSCLGTFNCELILSDFCPSIDITLKPSALAGDEIKVRYNCLQLGKNGDNV